METKEFVEICESCDFQPTKYSGRGMYGKECLGLDVGRLELHEALLDIISNYLEGAETVEESQDFVSFVRELDIRQDSLGLGKIIYFPELSWEEQEEEEGNE